MLASKKAIEQRQEAGAKAARIKKVLRKIDNSLLDQYRYDDYNTDK